MGMLPCFSFFFPWLCKCSFLDNLLLFTAMEEGAMLLTCSLCSRLYPWTISVHDLRGRH